VKLSSNLQINILILSPSLKRLNENAPLLFVLPREFTKSAKINHSGIYIVAWIKAYLISWTPLFGHKWRKTIIDMGKFIKPLLFEAKHYILYPELDK